MAKTLAQILAGEDMEGGENFCDDIYNNLKNHFYGAAAPGSPENGTMYLADDGFTYIYFDTVWYKLVGGTGAAWSKTIGATGNYATWAAMIAEMPDMIAHAVTIEIELGTTLTEICELKNKHGLTEDALITIQAEDYFPQAAVIPTATGSTVTTLIDVGQAWAIDRWIDCWVLIVDGTGTDNGFVKITDSDGTSVTVAAWPGAQPDNTSRYIIVGALIDCAGARDHGFDFQNNSVNIILCGIGIDDAVLRGMYAAYCAEVTPCYCGIHDSARSGFLAFHVKLAHLYRSGLVKNNTSSGAAYAGAKFTGCEEGRTTQCGLSDNDDQGIYAEYGGMCICDNNFGDGNGAWGAYAIYSAQIRIIGVECSGAGGNHSDPGTAGNANADQASAY